MYFVSECYTYGVVQCHGFVENRNVIYSHLVALRLKKEDPSVHPPTVYLFLTTLSCSLPVLYILVRGMNRDNGLLGTRRVIIIDLWRHTNLRYTVSIVVRTWNIENYPGVDPIVASRYTIIILVYTIKLLWKIWYVDRVMLRVHDHNRATVLLWFIASDSPVTTSYIYIYILIDLTEYRWYSVYNNIHI